MRKMQREKGVVKPEVKTPRATLNETMARINEQFSAGEPESETRKRFEAAEMNAARERASSLWKEANVPLRHSECKLFAKSEWTSALDRARAVMAKRGHVALIGGFGTGKTQIAVEMIRDFTSRGESALFTTSTQFLRTIKSCYRDEAKTTEADILNRHVKPRLLVIDEFHRRKGSEWENEQLFDLINERYNALKALIIICNQSRAAFDESMDGAILDRMNETGGVIECDWQSFRE